MPRWSNFAKSFAKIQKKSQKCKKTRVFFIVNHGWLILRKKRASTCLMWMLLVAEGEGFEPTERCKNAHLISSQAHSTTLSTLRNSPFRVLKCTNHAHVHPIGGAFAAQRYSEFLISPNPLYIIILKRFQKIIWQLLFHVIFAYINKVRELTQ